MGKHHRNHFLKHRALYEAAVQKLVCSNCIDLGEDGVCHTKDDKSCAIFRKLPEIVEVALELHEKNLKPYVKAVRDHVCSECGNSNPSGKCPVRELADCGLDRYLPLVIDAVEEVERQLRLAKTGTED